MENCEICQISKNQAGTRDVILQTERWRAVADHNQSYLGKSFIVLRQHKATLSDLDEGDWHELHEVIRQMERAVKGAFGADVCNWECLMNNAVKAGQPTHVHWHLYPRYLNGVRFMDEDFPDSKWPRHLENAKHVVDDELFIKIVAAMRQNLN